MSYFKIADTNDSEVIEFDVEIVTSQWHLIGGTGTVLWLYRSYRDEEMRQVDNVKYWESISGLKLGVIIYPYWDAIQFI